MNILQSLSEIDIENIKQNPMLADEYDAILSDITAQRSLSISNVLSSIKNIDSISLFKFLAGGVITWILALCIPFMDTNTFGNETNKIVAFLLLIVVGIFLGVIGYIIPTFFTPWLNYMGYPLLQIGILIILSTKLKNN